MIRRLATLGVILAMAGLLIGCVPVDPAPTSTTGAPPTTSEADLQACLTEKETIRTALEAYRADFGAGLYPGSLVELAGLYLEDLPGPEWEYTSDGTSYTLTGPC